MRLAQVRADLLGDAAEAHLAAQLLADRADVAVLRAGALGDDDDAVAAARRVAPLDALDDAVDVVGDLGQQDDVGVAGDARVHRDPARVAAHDLDDHDALVRLGGGVQPVDRLGRDGDGGVEAERRLRAGQVVVDRLRDADDRHALLEEARRDPERAVAADRDQRVAADLPEPPHDVVGDVDGHLLAVALGDELERVALVDRAEDRAAQVGDAAHLVARQVDEAVCGSSRPW